MAVSIHSEVFYSIDLTESSEIVSKPFELHTRYLEPFLFEPIRSIWNVNEKQLEKRWASKQSDCYLSFLEDAPVAYHWIQKTGKHFVQQAGMNIELKQENIVVIYHVRVSLEYQGKGIGTQSYYNLLHSLRVKGVKKCLIYTSNRNLANKRSLEKLGFREDFKMLSLKLGSKYYAFTNRNRLLKWQI